MLGSWLAIARAERRLALWAILAHVFIARCRAQTRAFQWTFGDNFLSTEVEECQNIDVVVESIDTNNASALGVAPYYMMAFESGGVPTTTLAGSNPAKLNWQVKHRRGSALMLTMVDTNGSTGGVSPHLFNVTAGNDTSCLPSAPASSIAHITPNVTGSVFTCEPWGLTLSNGTQPYSVVIAALDSPLITNISVPQGYDVFTYINRANPNGQMLAAVVDAEGQWGYATQVVNTAGNANTTCVGLVSSFDTTAEIAAQAAARAHAAAEAAKRRRTDIIVGVVVGVCGLLIIAGAAAWWWWRRGKAREDGTWDHQDTLARAWDAQDSTVAEVPRAREYRRVKTFSQDMPPMTSTGSPAYTPLLTQPVDAANEHTGSRPIPQPSPPATPPPDRSRRRRKGQKAPRYTTNASSSSAWSESSPGLSRTPQLPPLTFSQPLSVPALQASSPQMSTQRSRSFMLSPSILDPDVQPDIIIQHRDGGIVHELPPPYLDRYDAVSPESG